MSLASEIRNRLSGQGAAPAIAPVADANVLAKKIAQQQTGKAQTATGPKISNLDAETAAAQSSSKLEQVGQQAAVQGEAIQAASEQVAASLAAGKKDLAAKGQLKESSINLQQQLADMDRAARADESMARLSADESSRIRSINSKFSTTLDEMASARGIDTNDIFGQFERSNKDLAFRKDAAELEQLAHTMRMADTQYVDQITRVGKLRRLEDKLSFEREALELTLGAKQDILKQVLDFNWNEAMSDDEWRRELAKLDINSVIAISNAEERAANTKAAFEGAFGVAKVVAKQYDKDKT